MSAGRTVNSLSQDWGTPQKYVDAVKEFFRDEIDLDPCSNEYSIVGAKHEYRLPKHDGLRESWNFKKIYVNPPYGTDRDRGTRIKHWLFLCADAHKRFGSEVLSLIPVATNTGHWKNYVWGRATAVAFLYDTRLKFRVDDKDGGKGAPMSCSMVYWGKDYSRFLEVFIQYGAVVDVRPLWGRRIGEYDELLQPMLLDETEIG
jgi:hypothetical protein